MWLSTSTSTCSISPTKPTSVAVGAAGAIANSAPSSPESPTAGWPWRLRRCDDVRVDLAEQHHLRDLDRLGVGDAQAVDELDLAGRAAPCSSVISGPPPWTITGFRPTYLSRTTSRGEVLAQRRVAHRRAAVLDHDRAAVELPDVGQRLEQRLRCRRAAAVGHVAHVVYSALIRDVLVAEVAEEDVGLGAVAAAARSTYSTSAARRAPPSSAASNRRPAGAQTCTPSIATSIGAAPARAPCPPPGRSGPSSGRGRSSAVLTSGELAIARATRSASCRVGRRATSIRPTRVGALAVGDDRERELRSSASSASPSSRSSSDCGSTSRRARRSPAGAPCRWCSSGRRR